MSFSLPLLVLMRPARWLETSDQGQSWVRPVEGPVGVASRQGKQGSEKEAFVRSRARDRKKVQTWTERRNIRKKGI